MFQILPIQDKEEQKKWCDLCGVTYKPDYLAYSAVSEGAPIGMTQFYMTDEGGVIADFAAAPGADDREVLLVLGRGTMNFIDLCGIHRAYFDAPYADEQLIRQIGFSKDENGRYTVDLTDFFNEPCHHDCQKK